MPSSGFCFLCSLVCSSCFLVSWKFLAPGSWVPSSSSYRNTVITPPEVTNTGPGFNRGSGGGARGCGFEERVGAYARAEGFVSYSPRSVCVCVCVC